MPILSSFYICEREIKHTPPPTKGFLLFFSVQFFVLQPADSPRRYYMNMIVCVPGTDGQSHTAGMPLSLGAAGSKSKTKPRFEWYTVSYIWFIIFSCFRVSLLAVGIFVFLASQHSSPIAPFCWFSVHRSITQQTLWSWRLSPGFQTSLERRDGCCCCILYFVVLDLKNNMLLSAPPTKQNYCCLLLFYTYLRPRNCNNKYQKQKI